MTLASTRDEPLPGTSPLSAHSRFVQRIRRRYAAELALLPPGEIDAAVVGALVQRLRDGGRPLASALRVARQLCLERLACLDVDQAAPLAAVTQGMTTLAETALELALAHALAEVEQRHGVPRDAQGQRIEFWIVGMGKLGGRELNVSSDIDLVYVYEDEGETDGAGAAPGARTSERARAVRCFWPLDSSFGRWPKTWPMRKSAATSSTLRFSSASLSPRARNGLAMFSNAERCG